MAEARAPLADRTTDLARLGAAELAFVAQVDVRTADGAAAGLPTEPNTWARTGDREVLCVSQFALYADTRKGNRPSFTGAADRALAEALYERLCERLDARRGVFGARMAVELVNDGPVTVMLET